MALGMAVVGMRRHIDRADAVPGPGAGVALVAATAANLRREAAAADYVILSCPLTDETRGLFDSAMLARMKPTACLLNVARGAVVDEDALAAALVAGELAGAYLDCFSTEPLPSDHALWSAPNLIISPHDAATCADNAARVEAIFARNLEAVCSRSRGGSGGGCAGPAPVLENCVWPGRAKAETAAGPCGVPGLAAARARGRQAIVSAAAVLAGLALAWSS